MDAPRILVVDDDEGVRYAVCLALSALGYVPEAVSGASEALARFRPGRYRVVVTDVAMPVMNGFELVRRLRALEPGLPIMIFSGEYSTVESGSEVGGAMIVLKPNIDALTRLIQRALAGP